MSNHLEGCQYVDWAWSSLCGGGGTWLHSRFHISLGQVETRCNSAFFQSDPNPHIYTCARILDNLKMIKTYLELFLSDSRVSPSREKWRSYNQTGKMLTWQGGDTHFLLIILHVVRFSWVPRAVLFWCISLSYSTLYVRKVSNAWLYSRRSFLCTKKKQTWVFLGERADHIRVSIPRGTVTSNLSKFCMVSNR
jgi:hypothetical protein